MNNERATSSSIESFADSAAITAALCRAGRAAVLSHARAGNPVAVWRNGRVVWLQPAEILASLTQDEAAPVAALAELPSDSASS